MKSLDENTLMPARVIISMMSVIIGGAIWLTTIYISTNANAEKIVEIKTKVASYEEVQLKMYENINQIKQDVSEIKGEIKHLRSKK